MSFLSSIAGQTGAVTSQLLSDVLKDMPQLAGQISEGMDMSALHSLLTDMTEHVGGSSPAEGTWFTTVHESGDAAAGAGHVVEGLAQDESEAITQVQSGMPDVQLAGQEAMQNITRTFEGMQHVIEQQSEAMKHAIENLHSSVLDASPDAGVTTSTVDVGDGHQVAHDDGSSGHAAAQADHASATVAHDDAAAADASATAA